MRKEVVFMDKSVEKIGFGGDSIVLNYLVMRYVRKNLKSSLEKSGEIEVENLDDGY